MTNSSAQRILTFVHQLSLCFLACSINLPYFFISYILIGIAAAATLAVVVCNRQINSFMSLKWLPMLGLVAYYVLLALFSNSLPSSWHLIAKYLQAAAVPFLFAPVQWNASFVKKLFVSFSLGTLLAVVVSIVTILLAMLRYNAWLMPNYESTLSAINGLVVPIECTYIHRPYLGIFCAVALVMCYWLYQNSLRKWHKIACIAAMAVFALFPFYVLTRLACLCIIVVLGYIAYSTLKKLPKKYLVPVIIALLLSGGYALTSSNVIQRLKTYRTDGRMPALNCAKKIVTQPNFSIFTGFGGVERERPELLACYQSNIVKGDVMTAWAADVNLTPHNQFITFYLSGGIIALALFVSSFVLMVLEVLKKKTYTVALLIFLLLAFFCVEDPLRRCWGILYYALTYVIVMLMPFEKTDRCC